MNKTQLVTFQPMDAFFFGGETTFGNGEGRNFFAASNYFPQQTSLVGVLRYALLEAGIRNIGESFSIGKEPDFGDLSAISPVFIYHKDKGQEDFAIPLTLPLKEEETKDLVHNAYALSYEDNESVHLGHGWIPAPVVTDYKEKSGMATYLLFSNTGKLKSFEEVFQTVRKIGIARDPVLHTALDGMFYQQELYQLAKGYSFAAFVTGTEALFENLRTRNMTLGGEQVNFVLNTMTTSTSFDTLFNTATFKDFMEQKQAWIYLASDAYVHPDIYKHCQFAITQTRDFRNIITAQNHYTADLDQKERVKGRYKSEKFTLLKRGAVLFPKDKNEVIKALNNKAFRTIGYNYYFTNS